MDLRLRLPLLLAVALAACADAPDPTGPEGESLAIGPEDPEWGKAFFDPSAPADAKEDAIQGSPGMSVTAGADTMVWEVENDWDDTDTPAARKAGMAWPENSGLSWDQKYAAWIKSMRKIDSSSYFRTYELTTPFGKVLPAPAVECAETSIFLRAAFASWYKLPFILEATDSAGKRLYLGHFGFRTAEARYPGSPLFKTAYRDWTAARATTWQTQGWPQDTTLRNRKLGGSQDDFQPFLFEGARAGAYFDEIFLNKRVGYFMIYALSYFGSINLADPKNTYNLKPEAVREGDTLLERWQRRGIGHTLVVKNVVRHAEDALEVELISGSMPRRQANWESASSSKSYFVHPATGSMQEGSDGIYAKLGGGIKRWRIPKKIGGRWTMMVPALDRHTFIDASNTAAIGARPETFDRLLREVGPEEKREVLLGRIEAARQHLSRYPASCSARIRREDAFSELYDLESEEFGRTRHQVDAERRVFEDYVLPRLEYEKSKTCCWNSTNEAMFQIVMLKAQADVEDHGAAECRMPTTFRARLDGYDTWKSFAASIGRGAEWKAWSEDEPCAQRGVAEDTESEHEWTPWCEIAGDILE